MWRPGRMPGLGRVRVLDQVPEQVWTLLVGLLTARVFKDALDKCAAHRALAIRVPRNVLFVSCCAVDSCTFLHAGSTLLPREEALDRTRYVPMVPPSNRLLRRLRLWLCGSCFLAVAVDQIDRISDGVG